MQTIYVKKKSFFWKSTICLFVKLSNAAFQATWNKQSKKIF